MVARESDGILHGSMLPGDRTDACDVCIVGSGPGGAVAADELARANRDVLIIEEGSVPQPGATLTIHEAFRKYYRNYGLLTTNWPVQIGIFTGRAFGGTSVINSGTCLHTPDRVLEGWRKDLGIDFDTTVWREIGAQLDAEFSVSPCPMERMSASNRLFAEGLTRLGLNGGGPLPRFEKGCEGSGRCCFVCPKEAKQAVHLNILKRGLRHGMRAIVETEALRLVGQGGRIKSLICRTEAGGKLVVHAKHFILAMGALETPHFLLKHRLHRRYPALGRNLSIHPAGKVAAEMPEPVRSWEGVPQAYRYEHPDRPDVHFEGIFLPPMYGAMGFPLLATDLADWMSVFDRVVGFGYFISDSQLGRLFRFMGDSPIVRYGLTSTDLDNIHFAKKFIAKVFFAMGARRVILPAFSPHIVFDSMEAVERGFKRSDLHPDQVYSMGFHPLGTCRFAASDDLGVVDKFGKCHHHDNLYVCDGSAIPGPLHVNPQFTIMTFARLMAQHLP
jgi:choline dehydrogenase-like flavoprotein